MINEEFQLKLQALLDGELSAQEASEVRARIARDPEAQALLAELRNTKTALAGHGAEIKLPETRDFFWSKIQREIERQGRPATPAPGRGASWVGWVLRHWLPVGAVAAVTCVAALFAFHPGNSPAQFAEMELSSDNMGAYTFRDQQEKMTMIWFYDKDDSQFTQPASFATVPAE
jgi:anti-sigma factor RsiW